MKKIIKASLAVILMTATAGATAAQVLDRIVVVVDEDVITAVELEQRIDDITLQIKKPIDSDQARQALRKQVLEKMIRDRIQLQLAARLGIKIDDVSLNRTLERLAAANGLTLEQLRSRLAADSINYERFRQQTRDELVMQQLQQRLVANKVNVSEQEINQYIEDYRKQADSNARYKLRHILVSIPGTARPEQIQQAKSKAEQLYQRVREGEDFTTIAIQESAGRNALQGGELGWRNTSELPESFVSALRDIDVGETTQPIRSASGFHLLLLEDSTRQQNTVIQTQSRHILVTAKDDNDPAAILSGLRQRIIDGEDFAALAAEFSEDPGSKDNGGELGWADPGTFVPRFESTMQTLEAGEISQPFESRFGWHILQVLDRRESVAGRDALAKQAMDEIRKRKTEEELQIWLRKIRDEAFVEYIDSSIARN